MEHSNAKDRISIAAIEHTDGGAMDTDALQTFYVPTSSNMQNEPHK